MRPKRNASVFIFAALLSGTSNVHAADVCAPYKLKSHYANENKKFEELLQMDWDQFMKDTPEWASDLGYKQYAGLWSDESLEAIGRRDKQIDCILTSFKKVNRKKLNQQNQLTFDLYDQRLKLAIEGRKFDSEYLVLTQLSGAHTDIIDTLINMPDATPEDLENKLRRLETADLKLAQNKILMQEGLKRGVTAPQVVLSKVPPQFDGILTSKIEDSALYKPFEKLKALPPEKVAEYQKRARQIIENKLYPAFRDFKDFIVNTYIPNSRKGISVQELPNGKDWYKWSIRYLTTLDKNAEDIHEIGLKEVERITAQMQAIRQQVGFKKDLKAFNEYLLKDPKFFYAKPEELITGFRDIAKRADAELPKLFGTLPRMTYGIREIPAFKAASSPAAYYSQGSFETGRAGYFEANTTDLKARPKWGMEALTLHEAVPGHHLQIAISQELGELPKFRKYSYYTAFIEGWGLYAESLGDRMGFYEDPYSRYGQLTYEMWRAIRLVVDTGMHAKGWSREQALQYFRDHMAKGASEIEVEVDRYIVWPGQALAYKLGQMKILELREKAEKTLATKFDIRKYHDVVLGGGALPLNVLEKRVDEWVKKEAAESKLSKQDKTLR